MSRSLYYFAFVPSLGSTEPRILDKHLSAMLTSSDSSELYSSLLELYTESISVQSGALLRQVCVLLRDTQLILEFQESWILFVKNSGKGC